MEQRINFIAVMLAITTLGVMAGLTLSAGITGNAIVAGKILLKINSNPQNATIYLDNKLLVKGNAPAKTPYEIEVKQGKHVILIKKTGYKDKTIKLNVGKAQEVNAKLERNYTVAIENAGKGKLAVYSTPVSAAVFVDYKFRGYTPYHGTGYAIKYYPVTIEKVGYKPFAQTYYIGDYIYENTVSINLQPS